MEVTSSACSTSPAASLLGRNQEDGSIPPTRTPQQAFDHCSHTPASPGRARRRIRRSRLTAVAASPAGTRSKIKHYWPERERVLRKVLRRARRAGLLDAQARRLARHPRARCATAAGGSCPPPAARSTGWRSSSGAGSRGAICSRAAWVCCWPPTACPACRRAGCSRRPRPRRPVRPRADPGLALPRRRQRRPQHAGARRRLALRAVALAHRRRSCDSPAARRRAGLRLAPQPGGPAHALRRGQGGGAAGGR